MCKCTKTANNRVNPGKTVGFNRKLCYFRGDEKLQKLRLCRASVCAETGLRFTLSPVSERQDPEANLREITERKLISKWKRITSVF
jgi:hypothetical protein